MANACGILLPLVTESTASLTMTIVRMPLSFTRLQGRYAEPVLVVQLYSGSLPVPVRPTMGAMTMRAASPERVVSPMGYGATSFSPQCRPDLTMPALLLGVLDILKTYDSRP